MALCSEIFSSTRKRSCTFKDDCLKKACLVKDNESDECSTSSDELDSGDEQMCYDADQARAKRRASSRVSFSLDSKLSKAVAQYSDDEDHIGAKEANCKYVCSPSTVFTVSSKDKAARSRCFEYLVGAIDEAWARYCDITSSVENEVYGYNSPKSVVSDEEDYLGNSTDFTDYESDFYGNKSRSASEKRRNEDILSEGVSCDKKENQAASTGSLQALKDRLIKAKYFLQDLVDSDIPKDACAFWKRWDMIKYATIELVEDDDDDDDDVIESTVEELEDGRIYLN